LIIHGSDPLDVPAHAPPAVEETVSREGDIWVLGRHIIICGDCRTSADLTRVLKGEQIALGLTDPPYNVKIDGHVSGLGEVSHREFAMAAGEMSASDFEAFLRDSIGHMAKLAKPGTLLYLFMDWRHLPELQAATNALGLEPVNLCVWVKSNGGMGSFYRSQHELVWIVKMPGAGHINNVELGKHGRYRTNVWRYAGMNSFGAERDETLRLHPTVKPVAMIRDAILDASNPGDWVLDMFLGSGTTLIAAEQCGRRCLGIELDPGYVDVAVARWRELTGNEPRHFDLSKSWNNVAADRGPHATLVVHG
jgi:DNA modification methylase